MDSGLTLHGVLASDDGVAFASQVARLAEMTATDLLPLLEAFASEGVAYKVIGGVAMNLRGVTRATEDLDIFVRADAENIGRLRRALHANFHDPHIDEITSDDLAGEYPAVQYIPPNGLFHLDILARLGEQWAYDDIETTDVLFGGVVVPVATPAALVQMKSGTIRPQDHVDAARLRARFGLP